MAFDFPNSPVTGTTYTDAGVAWIYNGYLWRMDRAAPPATVLPNLTLSPNRIAERSLAGTVVGGLSGKTSGSTLSLVDTAGNRFALSGTNIIAGSVATDYETATSHPITVRETLAGAANSPNETVLTIFVDDVDETLPVITSPATYTVPENTAFSVQLTATKPVTWSKPGGADATLFGLTAAGLLTLPAQDFDIPADLDHNNSFLVTVRATDALAQSIDFPIAVNISNVLEALLNPLVASTSPLTIVAGSPAGTVVSNVSNKSQGSTLTMTVNAGGMFALSGLAIVTTTTPATIGNQVVTIRETHPDAINSPSLTSFTIVVTAPAPSPPIITSATSVTVNENVPVSLTLTANEVGTWSITGGADASFFVIDTSATGAEAFNFEAPEDANLNNVYEVEVTFTSSATGLTDVELMRITIADVLVEGGGATATLTGSQTLQAPTQSTAVGARTNISGTQTLAMAALSATVVAPATLNISQTTSPPFQTFGVTTQAHLTATQVLATGTQTILATTSVKVTAAQTTAALLQAGSIGTGVDVPGPPKITSGTLKTVLTNTPLAMPLTANEPVTWSLGTFADSAQFEISGSTLRWLGNGTKNFSSPTDGNADNTYVLQVKATDLAANVTTGTIFVTVVAVPDVTAPTITSPATKSVAENATLAHFVTASENVDWTITGGADAAKFEMNGTMLRWKNNGTKDFDIPDDANADNVYEVQVTATDGAGNATSQIISVTVTDVPGA
jgi:hypothetical protein